MIAKTGADGMLITRTIAVGQPSKEMRERFTLVLKGHIAVAMARFPKGTRGIDLDPFARRALWAHGLDYDHGTGHGVGINVHEFPPRVASVSLAKLEEGHVFSIEPGVYLAGRAGVRIENLCTVVPDTDPGFLRVQSMTFSPLDRRLMETSMLTAQEQAFRGGWISD